jgi:hypothetical protein
VDVVGRFSRARSARGVGFHFQSAELNTPPAAMSVFRVMSQFEF